MRWIPPHISSLSSLPPISFFTYMAEKVPLYQSQWICSSFHQPDNFISHKFVFLESVFKPSHCKPNGSETKNHYTWLSFPLIQHNDHCKPDSLMFLLQKHNVKKYINSECKHSVCCECFEVKFVTCCRVWNFLFPLPLCFFLTA